jgi:hypothetical protein
MVSGLARAMVVKFLFANLYFLFAIKLSSDFLEGSNNYKYKYSNSLSLPLPSLNIVNLGKIVVEKLSHHHRIKTSVDVIVQKKNPQQLSYLPVT